MGNANRSATGVTLAQRPEPRLFITPRLRRAAAPGPHPAAARPWREGCEGREAPPAPPAPERPGEG